MEKPEIPKPITWDYLKKTCMENLDSLLNARREFAMKGLLELEREMNTRFPGMTNTPWVVNVKDWQKALKNYRMLRRELNKDKKNVTEICRDAWFRIECILSDLAHTDYELEDAPTESHLCQLQVLVCFHQWLVKNKWQHKPLQFGYQIPEQITAHKKDKQIIVRFLGTCPMNKYHFEKFYLGPELLTLFKMKNKNPAAQIVLAVADDKETRNVFMQYVPYILKTGIRIFMVTAPDEAVELKK